MHYVHILLLEHMAKKMQRICLCGAYNHQQCTWWLPDDCLMNEVWKQKMTLFSDVERCCLKFFNLDNFTALLQWVLCVCVSQAKYKRPWDRTESPKVPDLLHRKGSSTSASLRKKNLNRYRQLALSKTIRWAQKTCFDTNLALTQVIWDYK